MPEEAQQPGAVDSQEGIPMPTAEDIIPRGNEYKEWIAMSNEEMLAAQEAGTLMGYNPVKGLGLVNRKETKKK